MAVKQKEVLAKTKTPSPPNLKTKYHSYCKGSFAEGCAQCVRGKKMVLFITGLCSQRCFYCPVSEDKFGKDTIFANEWQISNPKDPKEMIEECRLTEATGCGITGGDPLVKLDRTCNYITLLKNEFGKKFHIHLYTPMTLVTEDNLRRLHEAGLDEIRFHPNLDDSKDWNRITLAAKYPWKIGVEIPLVPGYEEKTRKLMDFLEGKIEFLNLNELEFSDTNAKHYKLDKIGFVQKDSVSYGVKGSEQMGLALLDYGKKKNYSIHVCTAKLKNMVQMGNRLKIRAKNSAMKFDIVTKEGFLYRGAAYMKGFEPGFDYKKRLDSRKKDDIIRLADSCKAFASSTKLKDGEYFIDLPRMRVLLSAQMLEKHSNKLAKANFVGAIVTEYPTSDFFTLELDFL